MAGLPPLTEDTFMAICQDGATLRPAVERAAPAPSTAMAPPAIGARHSRYRLVVLSRWRGWVAAAAVTLVACVLVALDLTDSGLRRWWNRHALTTDTIAGLLVLMITVLVVDQVVRRRQGNSRARAVAVQVAILMTQANRASQAVSEVLAASGDRDMAGEEFRSYTMMVLADRAGTDRRSHVKELPRASPAPGR